MGQLINRRRVLGGKVQYLTFTALESGTFTFTIPAAVTTTYMTSVSYSTNYGVTWVTTNNSSSDVTITTPTVYAGDTVMWKGVGTQVSKSNTNPTDISRFSSTGTFRASGNVMSMLYGDDFYDKTSFRNGSTYNLSHLFSECSTLVSIVGLQLPAITLTNYCYSYMFGYTAITSMPSGLLPATTLATYCYQGMFSNCSSLTTVSVLPAITLAQNCYEKLFYSCTSLTSLPNNMLPATTMAPYCYLYMFAFSGVTSIPSNLLPATTLADYCYEYMFSQSAITSIPSGLLPATILAASCYRVMFYKCTSLITAASDLLPAPTLTNACYRGMFSGCSNITTVPVLPAVTLISECYVNMFNSCSKLAYIKAMFTTKPTNTYTQGWVTSVKSSGTFVKNSAATWNVTGTNGVPSGWTVQTASS